MILIKSTLHRLNFFKSHVYGLNLILCGDIIFDLNYPEEPTDKAKIDSSGVNFKLLGKNDLGYVELLGPFGNQDSKVKIAYLVGMHPFESKVHKALFDMIVSLDDSLKYCYYIYNTNVAESFNKEGEGRMEGQLLAQKFIAPDVIGGDYDFVVDIHSNKGLRGPGTYEEPNFIFAPGFDDKSTNFMNILLDGMDEIVYYAPEYRTSPPYITIPIAEAGIPTIIYETFSYEAMQKTYDLVEKLVKSIDNLEF